MNSETINTMPGRFRAVTDTRNKIENAEFLESKSVKRFVRIQIISEHVEEKYSVSFDKNLEDLIDFTESTIEALTREKDHLETKLSYLKKIQSERNQTSKS